jgi:predicted kinase
VVRDFGLWSKAERSALRSMAQSLDAASVVIYMPVDEATQERRIRRRLNSTPEETYPITPAALATWRTQFEVPDEAGLTSDEVDSPPPGWSTWWAWAIDRWPGLQSTITTPGPDARNGAGLHRDEP